MKHNLFKEGKRRCWACKKVLELNFDNFYRDKYQSGGYGSCCKKCKNHQSKIQKRKRRKYKGHKNEMEGFVYIMKCEGWYKIGCTKGGKAMKNRLRDLNVGNPFTIELKYKIKTENMYTLENELHEKFENKRGKGEWFKLDQSDIEYILNL